MKVQYNSKTKMTWLYVPTDAAKMLGLKKGDILAYEVAGKSIRFMKEEDQPMITAPVETPLLTAAPEPVALLTAAPTEATTPTNTDANKP